MFNCASCLTRQTLCLWFLFQYESVSKPCMTNAQSGYNDLFSSRCSKSWLRVRVFDNGSGDGDSISGQVIPKIQKMVLDAYLLNTQGKWSNPGKRVVPSSTPQYDSY